MRVEVKPCALMIHNPNAEIRLPREMWLGIPEFFLDGKLLVLVGRGVRGSANTLGRHFAPPAGVGEPHSKALTVRQPHACGDVSLTLRS
jgi:hypothetical protein